MTAYQADFQDWGKNNVHICCKWQWGANANECKCWVKEGGSLRDQAGLQTHHLQKQVFLQKSDFGKTCLSAGCFVQKSTLPDPSRFPPVTFQEDFPIECLSFGGLHGCNQKKTPIFIEGAQLHNCRCVQLCLNTILDPGILGDTQTQRGNSMCSIFQWECIQLWDAPTSWETSNNRAPFLGLPIKGRPIICDPALVYLWGSLLLFPRIDVIFDFEHFPRGVHVWPTASLLIILLLSLDCFIALLTINCFCFAFAFLRSSDYYAALISSSLLLLLSACLIFRLLCRVCSFPSVWKAGRQTGCFFKGREGGQGLGGGGGSRCWDHRNTQVGGGVVAGGKLVQRDVGVDWDQLGSEQRVHLTSVEGCHSKSLPQRVTLNQGQLDVSCVKDLILSGQNVLGE